MSDEMRMLRYAVTRFVIWIFALVGFDLSGYSRSECMLFSLLVVIIVQLVAIAYCSQVQCENLP